MQLDFEDGYSWCGFFPSPSLCPSAAGCLAPQACKNGSHGSWRTVRQRELLALPKLPEPGLLVLPVGRPCIFPQVWPGRSIGAVLGRLRSYQLEAAGPLVEIFGWCLNPNPLRSPWMTTDVGDDRPPSALRYVLGRGSGPRQPLADWDVHTLLRGAEQQQPRCKPEDVEHRCGPKLLTPSHKSLSSPAPSSGDSALCPRS